MDSASENMLIIKKINAIVEDFFKNQTDYGFINNDLELKLDAQEGCRLLDAVIIRWLGEIQLFCEEVGETSLDNQVNLPYKFTFKSPSEHCWCRQAGAILDKIFGDRQVFLSLPFIRRAPNPWFKPYPERYFEFYWSDLKIYAEGGEEGIRQNREESLRIAKEFIATMP